MDSATDERIPERKHGDQRILDQLRADVLLNLDYFRRKMDGFRNNRPKLKATVMKEVAKKAAGIGTELAHHLTETEEIFQNSQTKISQFTQQYLKIKEYIQKEK